MSRFDALLEQARARQRSVFLLACLLAAAAAVFALLLFTYSRGVRVQVLPEAIRPTASLVLTQGLGFTVGHTVYALGSRSRLAVTAPGYRPRTVEMGEEDVLAVRLEPLPGRLRITVQPESGDTAWVVDGRRLAPAPALDQTLSAGGHRIRVEHPYYQAQDLEVALQPGEQRHIPVELIPVPGRLSLSSEPPGAAVFLDGSEIGHTPLAVDRPGGRYEVLVRRQGYAEVRDSLEIRAQRPELQRNYRLAALQSRAQAPPPSPGGGSKAAARVAARAATPAAQPAARTATKPPQAESSAAKPDKPGKPDWASPPAGRGLARAPAGQSADPAPGAPAPGPVDQVEPAKQSPDPAPGAPSAPAAPAPSVPAAPAPPAPAAAASPAGPAPAPLPREYVNKAGGVMRLFRPDETFLMGAARHEPGQRANEHIRRVRLRRPFYAGLHELRVSEYRKFRPVAGDPAQPVVGLRWLDIVRFCNWLSREEGLAPFYVIAGGRVQVKRSAPGYRLLTEAEWEWLARKAGRASRQNFAWGNERVLPPGAANVADESARGKVRTYIPGYHDGQPGLAPAGSFSKEPSGLYDLSGNVSEWTHDFYSVLPEQGGVEEDPLGPASGEGHVIKGGNWRSGTLRELRAAFRSGGVEGQEVLGARIGRYGE